MADQRQSPCAGPGRAPVFHVDPDALYSPAALATELEGIMTLDTFLLRVKPRKRFKGAYFGQDILDGISSAPPLDNEGVENARAPVIEAMVGRPRRRSGRWIPCGLEPLDPKSL